VTPLPCRPGFAGKGAAWLLLAAVSSGCGTRETASSASARQISFEEVSTSANVRHRWRKHPRPLRNIDTLGVGCAFFDYDADGWLDILLVDEPTPRLFRNRANGAFEDATRSTRLQLARGAWKGCAVGDVDGDGLQDLLLLGYRSLSLLRNAPSGWQDITRAAGLDPRNRSQWGTGAGFMDLDADGWLDLVLLNYVVFGPAEPQFCDMGHGIRSGCPPSYYSPEFPELWRNERGRLRDVTSLSGLKNSNGKSLVLAFADVDDDGMIDFYVGNDTTPSELYRNLGGLRFENVGVSSGAAYGVRFGTPMAAMCADWGDFDRDGRLDLVVTGNSNEAFNLLRNQGQALFESASQETGLADITYRPLGFGGKWIDFENDGWPDLAFANGDVQEKRRREGDLQFRQPLMLLRNEEGRRFRDLVPELGGALAEPILGRGLAAGDYDNDGRMDLLVVDYEGDVRLFRNTTRSSGHWVRFTVRSDDPNRYGYGARIAARAGKSVWVADVSPASSFLSSSDPRVHFGLGETRVLDEVTVRWLDGRSRTLTAVAVDREVVLTPEARK
jgi:enediyne biosynthesis protein E4